MRVAELLDRARLRAMELFDGARLRGVELFDRARLRCVPVGDRAAGGDALECPRGGWPTCAPTVTFLRADSAFERKLRTESTTERPLPTEDIDMRCGALLSKRLARRSGVGTNDQSDLPPFRGVEVEFAIALPNGSSSSIDGDRAPLPPAERCWSGRLLGMTNRKHPGRPNRTQPNTRVERAARLTSTLAARACRSAARPSDFRRLRSEGPRGSCRAAV